jgi:hypothetical protein
VAERVIRKGLAFLGVVVALGLLAGCDPGTAAGGNRPPDSGESVTVGGKRLPAGPAGTAPNPGTKEPQ